MSYRVMNTGRGSLDRLIVQVRKMGLAGESGPGDGAWIVSEHQFQDWLTEVRELARSITRLTVQIADGVESVRSVEEAQKVEAAAMRADAMLEEEADA